MNINEIIKIPKYSDKDIDEITNCLQLKFEYDNELYKNDDEYRRQIREKLFDQVINSNDDKAKLSLLYSLRGFFDSYRHDSVSKTLNRLVFSFNDKSLIPQITKYLENEKQIDNMEKMITYYARGKAINPKELDELNEVVISEIQNRKQDFFRKQEKKLQDMKDSEIILKLDELQKENYPDMSTSELAEKIKELSKDELKISAMETYFNEICNKYRADSDLDSKSLLFLMKYMELKKLLLL